MIRQPDLKTVAAKIRDIVGSHQGSQVSHQKSLNLAAEMFGFKNWTHYEQVGLPVPSGSADKAERPHAKNADEATLRSALDWVASNYKATLSGKPVRDADECLQHAEMLLETKSAVTPFSLGQPFTFFTETRPTLELGEGPSWVELTIDRRFIYNLLSMRAMCEREQLDEARAYTPAISRWEPEGVDGDFNMRGERLVVTLDDWFIRAYPKHCDYEVLTSNIHIRSFMEAVKAYLGGARDAGWTAYRWVDNVLLYSASGDTAELVSKLQERRILHRDLRLS